MFLFLKYPYAKIRVGRVKKDIFNIIQNGETIKNSFYEYIQILNIYISKTVETNIKGDKRNHLRYTYNAQHYNVLEI